LIPLSKVRLVVEQAFADRKPIVFPYVVFMSMFCTCVCVVGIIIAYVRYEGCLDERWSVGHEVMTFSDARGDFFASILSWIYYWGTLTSTVEYESIVAPLNDYDWNVARDHFHYFPLDSPWDKTALIFNERSRSAYDRTLRIIDLSARTGGDISQIAGPLFSKNSAPVRFCNEVGVPKNWFQGSLWTIWAYICMESSLFKSVDDATKWFSESEPVCLVISTIVSLADSLNALRTSMVYSATPHTEATLQELRVMGIVLPVCLFVLTMVSLATVTFMYVHEGNNFTSLLMKLPPDVKRECTKPLRRDLKRAGDAQAVFTVPKYSLPAVFNVSVLIVLAGCSATIFAQFRTIQSCSEFYTYLGIWAIAASDCKFFALESVVAAELLIRSYNNLTAHAAGPEYNYLHPDKLTQMASIAGKNLVSADDLLFGEAGLVPSASGYNKQIDTLSLSELCLPNASDRSYHENYRCSGLHQLIQCHVTAIDEVVSQPAWFGGRIEDHRVAELIHLMDRHLLSILSSVSDRFLELGKSFIGDFLESQHMFLAIQLVILFVCDVVLAVYCMTMNSCFDVLLAFMR
jgi:hypothetical protein